MQVCAGKRWGQRESVGSQGSASDWPSEREGGGVGLEQREESKVRQVKCEIHWGLWPSWGMGSPWTALSRQVTWPNFWLEKEPCVVQRTAGVWGQRQVEVGRLIKKGLCKYFAQFVLYGIWRGLGGPQTLRKTSNGCLWAVQISSLETRIHWVSPELLTATSWRFSRGWYLSHRLMNNKWKVILEWVNNWFMENPLEILRYEVLPLLLLYFL